MKKRWFWVLGGLGLYMAALLVLLYAESFSPEAGITTLGQALWYSLVTMSTVGYGDLFPVTPVGRLVGVVFLLLSTGLLALLLGAAVSLMTGTLLPRLRLCRQKKRFFYIFHDWNSCSAVLAEQLQREEPETRILFCAPRDVMAALEAKGFYRWDGTLESAAAWKKKDCALLVLGPESAANFKLALPLAEKGHRVYCQTELSALKLPASLTLFDRWESCARLYWRQHPLGREEKRIIFIGGGRYTAALLEQALLVNVFEAGRRVSYHVFGDRGEFCRCHPELETALGDDRLIFHAEPWNDDAALLARASRILLCSEDEEENLGVLQKLHRFFPSSGKVHVHLSEELPDIVCFGSDAGLFTPELLLRRKLSRAAVAMHEIYRRSVGGATPAWEELSDFVRRSNLAAADHLFSKIRVLLPGEDVKELTGELCRRASQRYEALRAEQPDLFREMEHRRWLRFYALHNWRWGPERNALGRTHPDMRPFAELSEAEQRKDDYAWELLGELAAAPETRGGA